MKWCYWDCIVRFCHLCISIRSGHQVLHISIMTSRFSSLSSFFNPFLVWKSPVAVPLSCDAARTTTTAASACVSRHSVWNLTPSCELFTFRWYHLKKMPTPVQLQISHLWLLNDDVCSGHNKLWCDVNTVNMNSVLFKWPASGWTIAASAAAAHVLETHSYPLEWPVLCNSPFIKCNSPNDIGCHHCHYSYILSDI